MSKIWIYWKERAESGWMVTVLACIFGAVLLAFLQGRFEYRHIQFSNDSSGYQLLAVNLLRGHGWKWGVVEEVSNYDPATRQVLKETDFLFNEKDRIGKADFVRTPGYPIFLYLIYRLHGVRLDAVLWYQIGLAGLTGALIVLGGRRLFGTAGLVVGLISVWLLGMNPNAAYPVSELVAECLSGFLLTAAFVASLYTTRREWLGHSIASLLLGLAILTRPGLLFVSVWYCIILIGVVFWPGMFWSSHNKEADLSRGRQAKSLLAFIITLAFVLLPWTIYASVHEGRFVALSTVTEHNIRIGLDPQGYAIGAGRTPPPLTVGDLMHFWDVPGPPPKYPRTLMQEVVLIPQRWHDVIAITRIKIRAATMPVPHPVWPLMVVGFAALASIRFYRGTNGNKESINSFCICTCGWLKSRRLVQALYLVTGVVIGIEVLGYSHTFLQLYGFALLVIMPLCRIVISCNSDEAVSPNIHWPTWLLSWMLGFIFMIVISFGIPRYIWPFLPVFYLAAALGMVLTLCAVGVMVLSIMNKTLVTWRKHQLRDEENEQHEN